MFTLLGNLAINFFTWRPAWRVSRGVEKINRRGTLQIHSPQSPWCPYLARLPWGCSNFHTVGLNSTKLA